MTNQFSPKVSEILAFSREEAVRLSCQQVEPEHLLLAILRAKNSPLASLFQAMNINAQTVKAELEKKYNFSVRSEPGFCDTVPSLSDQASDILKLSVLEARLQHSKAVGVQHIVLAILHNQVRCPAKDILEKQGVDYELALKFFAHPTESGYLRTRLTTRFLERTCLQAKIILQEPTVMEDTQPGTTPPCSTSSQPT